MVFRISLLLAMALAVVAGLAPQPFEAASNAALAAVIQHAGWLYLLIVFLTLVFLAWLAFGPTARLRIGGRDAEPEFSNPTWLSMLFAAGMGIGLVFWGAAEPISHVVTRPRGCRRRRHWRQARQCATPSSIGACIRGRSTR